MPWNVSATRSHLEIGANHTGVSAAQALLRTRQAEDAPGTRMGRGGRCWSANSNTFAHRREGERPLMGRSGRAPASASA